MEKGLFLSGMIVASRIDKGIRKDDGKPWCARVSSVTTGTEVFTYRESGLDATEDYEPLPDLTPVRINCQYARTENGNTTVGGDCEFLDAKKASKQSTIKEDV